MDFLTELMSIIEEIYGETAPVIDFEAPADVDDSMLAEYQSALFDGRD